MMFPLKREWLFDGLSSPQGVGEEWESWDAETGP